MFHRTSYFRNEEKLRGEILKINGETTKVENFRSGKKVREEGYLLDRNLAKEGRDKNALKEAEERESGPVESDEGTYSV